MEFVARMTRIRALAFYVVKEESDDCAFRRLDIPEAFHREYKAGMCQYDPFSFTRVPGTVERAALLSQMAELESTPETQHYVRFLKAHGFDDIVEAVFRSETRVLGGISLLLRRGEDCSQVAAVVDAMQPYIEYNLRGFTGRSKIQLREDLTKSFLLSPRELDVTELLMLGETNNFIAESLHISVATVKSHVLKIFEKVGVQNRASLVSLLSEYETH
ncbi:LuxR C-terminal-related transcriptional regulator [Paraburkholderia sp. CNPSo 3272]|uniref:helix-turn-helix transcriptional regulator n=1 Tax=Paraburkholderia sp. CNPSo 3272 TaxID=2940931 RepID=UPI0020B73920|nr:LuxR C-terminal-related transcriptional regulator [Paraburkholderia sp. CNPSo 3272]MCP3727111.1 LuxR C-terminal-related transcriptional regulator [Paraburkholderia sp. CNPSo 3272]